MAVSILKNFRTVERIWKTAPNAKIAITNGTRLLREKDLAKLRHIQGIKIRLSVDGWGPQKNIQGRIQYGKRN